MLLRVLLLFLFVSCSKGNDMGFSFTQKGEKKETVFSALATASSSFNLSKGVCSGEGDQLLPYYFDGDKDSFGLSKKKQFICNSTYEEVYGTLPSPSWVPASGDCDDENPQINPGAIEVCDDSDRDEDCDGVIDPEIAYLDADKDGFGSLASSFDTADCMLPPSSNKVNYVFNNSDCDDSDPNVGEADTYFEDSDGDGFGANMAEAVKSCSPLEGHALNSGDCNDEDPAIQTVSNNPDIEEDLDCDEVDDKSDLCTSTLSSLLGESDLDNDGCFGEEDCDDSVADPNKLKSLDNDCDTIFSWEDCDDNDSSNTSTVSNLSDRDCDGIEEDDDCDDYDADSETRSTDGDCDGVLKKKDCDDEDESKPTYDEDCDGVLSSSDCDDANSLDTSVATLWYRDLDGDETGSTDTGVYSCAQNLDADDYVLISGDVCDHDASRLVSAYENDEDCDDICDEGVTAVAMDEDCDGVCDEVGGGAAYDEDCDGYCDGNDEISSIVDKNCDESCDSDTVAGESVSSLFDKNCDAACDSDTEGTGNLISEDKDCDNKCDEGTEGAGNFFYSDMDCDNTCDEGTVGEGISLSIDSDCDALCDETGLEVSLDGDCNGLCDDISQVNLRFHEGSLVICPPGFGITGGKCSLRCRSVDGDQTCPEGWADTVDEADCSWDPTNRCDPTEYEIPCVGSWPHNKTSGSGYSTPKKYSDRGSYYQYGFHSGWWNSSPLLVTKDLLESHFEPVHVPMENKESFQNCQGDSCEDIDFDFFFDESSNVSMCPPGLSLNADEKCQMDHPYEVFTDGDGKTVLCPPGYSYDDGGSCYIACTTGSCQSDWADEDDDPETDCSWEGFYNYCQPQYYELPCWSSWPGDDPEGQYSKELAEESIEIDGYGYSVYKNPRWYTNPVIKPDFFQCE